MDWRKGGRCPVRGRHAAAGEYNSIFVAAALSSRSFFNMRVLSACTRASRGRRRVSLTFFGQSQSVGFIHTISSRRRARGRLESCRAHPTPTTSPRSPWRRPTSGPARRSRSCTSSMRVRFAFLRRRRAPIREAPPSVFPIPFSRASLSLPLLPRPVRHRQDDGEAGAGVRAGRHQRGRVRAGLREADRPVPHAVGDAARHGEREKREGGRACALHQGWKVGLAHTLWCVRGLERRRGRAGNAWRRQEEPGPPPIASPVSSLNLT